MQQFAEGYAIAVLTACAILLLYAWAKSRQTRPRTRETDREPGL
jgi:hypothetical protein